MDTNNGRRLPRRIIGGIFLLFCLFWLLFSIVGVFSEKYHLTVGTPLGLIFSAWGGLSVLSKFFMLTNKKENTSAGASILCWVFVFCIIRQLFPILAPIVSAFPIWYIIGTIIFFIVSPLIDLVETIQLFIK